METAERRRETGGILCFQNPAGEAVDDPGLGGAMLIASAARRVPRAPGSQYERRTRPRRRTRSKLRPEPRLKQRSGAVSARPRDRRSSPELCVKVRGSSSMLLLGCLGDLLRFEKREIQVATFAPDRSSP